MEAYKTLAHDGEGRYEEKKSVFLAYARAVKSESEASAFIASVKKKYPDARHHVYAYLLREGNATRYSDDREPQGTAGMPLLELLRHGELCDACLVVVRYFGGTLLGTGGLVRAYTNAGKAALEDAGTLCVRPYHRVSVSLCYADHVRVRSLFERDGVRVTDTVYGESVTVEAYVPLEDYEGFCAQMTDASNGRAAVTSLGIVAEG